MRGGKEVTEGCVAEVKERIEGEAGMKARERGREGGRRRDKNPVSGRTGTLSSPVTCNEEIKQANTPFRAPKLYL